MPTLESTIIFTLGLTIPIFLRVSVVIVSNKKTLQYSSMVSSFSSVG
jgi:hypothetical protein